MELYNLDEYSLSNRNSTYGGQSGDKEGILIGQDYWLVKYPKKGTRLRDVKNLPYSTSPVSEFLGSQVYEILGYKCHKTILGIRNDYVVVGCKDFCEDDERLIEFRQLKNTYNKNLSEKLDLCFSSMENNHFINLEEIRIHLDYNPSLQNISGLKEQFWDCVVIDGFINNNDRNNGNWGLIRGSTGDRLSPIFDNGAAFSPNVPESKIISKLNNQESLISSACNGITAYSSNGENNALFRDIIKLDIPDLKKAIIKNTPLIQKCLPDISNMINEIPESIGKHSVISKERKAVYLLELKLRLENILMPEYTKIVNNER